MKGVVFALPWALALLSIAAAAPLPDPTQPSRPRFNAIERRASGDGTLRVQGIFGTADARLAVVNGQLVRRGSKLGAVEITAVLADGVEYRSNGRLAVARLPLQR